MNSEKEHPFNVLVEQAGEEERERQMRLQKPLRTLESDIQEAIQERNASTASMVMAQQTKNLSSQQRMSVPGSGKKILIISASVIMVAFGIGGISYLYLLQSPSTSKTSVAQQTIPIPNIITPDDQKILDMTGLQRETAMMAVKNALSNVGNADGSILQIIPVQKESTGTENDISASDFITQLAIPAPNVLLRSLNDEWMMGTYNDHGMAAPFIILTDNFFQNAYAGMIAWENTLPDDFSNVFGYTSSAAEQENATSTSAYFAIQGSFKDGVIENKDVRAFFNPNGTMLILYSFVNNGTIVIATDKNALVEIINRLEKQTFIR